MFDLVCIEEDDIKLFAFCHMLNWGNKCKKKSLFIVSKFNLLQIVSGSPASYSIENVWKSTRSVCSCKPKPVWVEGVQGYAEATAETVKKFPPGPLLDQATEVMIKFEAYLTKLVTFSN